MKKKLFLALLTTLVLLLAATTALAVSPSDYNCPVCGEPCTEWYGYHGGDGTVSVHSPACYSCNVFVWDTEFLCTPAEGTATCTFPAVCSVCGSPDWLGSAPDPNAHGDMSIWLYASPTQHYRYCLNCRAEASIEYEDHYGGTATCNEHAVCEGCGEPYGEYASDNHDWEDWEGLSTNTHIRVCRDCDAEEEAPHTGGDGSCFPICEVCSWYYIDPDGEHPNMCDWFPESDTQHRRYCLTCGTYESNEYEDHYGGTATCTQRAVCEGCGTEYGEYSDVHPWGEWEYLDDTRHQRPCTNPDCHASDYADHSGGDGSCRPECEGCGNLYYNAEGQHRTMSVWYYLDGAQHMRHCVDCGYGQEYEDHTGGTATCSAQAVCEVCHEDYGELDGTRHGEFSDWETIGTTQHSRYCLECGANEEYEDHYGGTATCSSRAICEGCGSSYGELNLTVHTNMSEWEPCAGGHQRHCLDCNLPTSFERAPHTGDGACQSECIDCHESFIDPNGEHSLTDWLPENDTQHVRYCEICQHNDTYEYADHVGDGTCTSECKDCGMTFTDPDGTHRLTQWSASSSKKHIRYCPDCELEFTFEFGEHRPNANAEDLPCYKTITCTDCGYNMGFGTQHSLSDWVSYSPLQHFRYCTVGGTDHVEEYDLHYGGDGSCMPVCEGCGEAYLPLSGTHQWGEWTPNADGTHTRVCALNADHTETADCTWGDWTLADDQYHVRACTDCGDEENGEHTGGTATCYSPRICDVCNEGYGSPDNSGLSGHPNPVIEQKAPTCYEEGYYRVTCDHPGCAMPFFEITTPANGQHLYSNWQPADDGSHISPCLVCGEEHIVTCTVFRTLEGLTPAFAACPICGVYDGGVLAVIYAHDGDESLPYGTLVIRGGEAPVDGVLYAITVTGSYYGKVVELMQPVTVTVPMALEGFRIVSMDGADIPFTLADGMLTFEAEAVGLFLLIPAE